MPWRCGNQEHADVLGPRFQPALPSAPGEARYILPPGQSLSNAQRRKQEDPRPDKSDHLLRHQETCWRRWVRETEAGQSLGQISHPGNCSVQQRTSPSHQKIRCPKRTDRLGRRVTRRQPFGQDNPRPSSTTGLGICF